MEPWWTEHDSEYKYYFLKEYETFVVKAEKAAQTNKISDLTKLSLESAKLAEKCEALEDSDEWTIADTKKYLDLSTRCTNAISKLSSSTTSAASSALDDYDAFLNNGSICLFENFLIVPWPGQII